MLPTPARSRKACKMCNFCSNQQNKFDSPLNEENLSVIAASTPCIPESQGASDVKGIVGELELAPKGIGTITDFQEPQSTTPKPMQLTHIKRECDVCTFTGPEGAQMFKAVFDM